MRLYLGAGFYGPEDSWPGRPAGLTSTLSPSQTDEIHSAHPTGADAPAAQTAHTAIKGWQYAVGLLLLVLAGVATTAWFASRPPALKQFWEPFVKSSEPVLFCIADQSQYSTIRLRDATDPQREITLTDSMITIIIDDVSPLVNVAAFVRTLRKTFPALLVSP